MSSARLRVLRWGQRPVLWVVLVGSGLWACGPIEENGPSVVSLGTTRPRKPQPDGASGGQSSGQLPPQTACDGAPLPALALAETDECKAVSFEADVFAPLMSGAQACNQAACHGDITVSFGGGHLAGTAAEVWERMRTTRIANKPYIDVCSTDPSASAIACNLERGDGACGSPMPPSPAPQVDAAVRDRLATWLRCGAPNN